MLSKILKISCFILIEASLSAFATLRHPEVDAGKMRTDTVFGDKIFYFAQSQKTLNLLQKTINSNKKIYQNAWDPDCLWRQQPCQLEHPKELKEILELADELQKESNNTLEFKLEKNGKSYRDFGAMGQSMFLQKLVEVLGDKSWSANFSGDIYVSPSYKANTVFEIGDPLSALMTFAKIDMAGGGWLVASGDESQGTSIRPAADKSMDSRDYEMVVLVADPSMNGARIDAWATAMIVGGNKVKQHLESLSKYSGKWGYISFAKNGEIFCSTYLKCDLKDPKNRKVSIIGRPNPAK